jgi:hypothetical protein
MVRIIFGVMPSVACTALSSSFALPVASAGLMVDILDIVFFLSFVFE